MIYRQPQDESRADSHIRGCGAKAGQSLQMPPWEHEPHRSRGDLEQASPRNLRNRDTNFDLHLSRFPPTHRSSTILWKTLSHLLGTLLPF